MNVNAFMDPIRRTFGAFDSSGLRHPTGYLESIRYKIPFWDIERQAQFVDRTCKHMVDHNQTMMVSKSSYYALTATSVGNLAYIALNHRDQDTSDLASEILREYRRWCEIQKKAGIKKFQ
jgi:hypothetical protein